MLEETLEGMQVYPKSEWEVHVMQRFFKLPIKYLHVQEQADQGSLPMTQHTIAWAALIILQD